MATDRFVNNMSVALFGGTFNPVHLGHLRIAVELAELLEVDSLRMIPCSLPHYREALSVSAEQRLAMLQAAELTTRNWLPMTLSCSVAAPLTP